ncbi:unnamed protein product [Moneuplotes crassus]|uniref:Uncharacterized protein n=1 Tax=Euplotes crassus TaxID=5936 RepID=A0AAD2D2B0_EUPCR|nr:unnamed protein product [Moneuplotes crassus]
MKNLSLHKRLSRKNKNRDLLKLRSPQARIISPRPTTKKCIRIQALDFSSMSFNEASFGDNSPDPFQAFQNERISSAATFDSPPKNRRRYMPKKETFEPTLPFLSPTSEKSKRWERVTKVIEKEFSDQQEKVRMGFRQFKKYKRVEKRNLPFINTKYYIGISTLVE